MKAKAKYLYPEIEHILKTNDFSGLEFRWSQRWIRKREDIGDGSYDEVYLMFAPAGSDEVLRYTLTTHHVSRRVVKNGYIRTITERCWNECHPSTLETAVSL